MIQIGMRAHDIQAINIMDLCSRLQRLKIKTIQFVPRKSFPKMDITKQSVREMKRILDENDIHVSIYGCYIDPLDPQGERSFQRHMEYAALLGAETIGTETALIQSQTNETKEKYESVKQIISGWVKRAETLGISVGIEAVIGFPIHSIETTAALLEEIPSKSLKIIWDPANLIDKSTVDMQREIFS